MESHNGEGSSGSCETGSYVHSGDSFAKLTMPFSNTCDSVQMIDKETIGQGTGLNFNKHTNDTNDGSSGVSLKPKIKGTLSDAESGQEADVNQMVKLSKTDTYSKSEQPVCPYCSKTIKNKCTFLKHKDYCLRKITWTKKCTFCEKMFRDNYGLKRHLKVHGINLTAKTFECTYCRKCFRDNYNMSKHVDAVHKIDKVDPRHFNSSVHFQCNHCQSFFKDRISLRRHTRVEHASVVHKCGVCKKKFTDTHIFNSHIHRCKGSLHELPENKRQKTIAASSHYCPSKYFGNVTLCEKCPNASKTSRSMSTCTVCKLVLPNTGTPEKHLLEEQKCDDFYNKTKVERKNVSERLMEDQNLCVVCLYHSSPDAATPKHLIQYNSCSLECRCLVCGISFDSGDELIFHYDTEHEEHMGKLCDVHRIEMSDIKRQNLHKFNVFQAATFDTSKELGDMETGAETLHALQPIQHAAEVFHQHAEDVLESLDENSDDQFTVTDIDKESRILYSKSLDILFRGSDHFVYNDLI